MPIVSPRLIVELYEGWGYSGKRAVVVDSIPDLTQIGFFDRVFSLRVFKGPGYGMNPDHKLVLYDREHFQGNKLVLGPGFYPNLQDVSHHFATARSLRLQSVLETSGPEFGGISLIIETYSLKDYRGRKVTIVRDVPACADYGLDNAISSLRILKGPNFPRKGCRVIFYSAENFSGMALPIEMRPQDYKKEIPDLSLLPKSFTNIITSIKIEGWSSATEFDRVVFEEEFKGASLDAGWQWVDPMGGGEWRANQGYLEMRVQPGQDLWYGANYDAPRILRPIAGDFAIETRLPVETTLLEHGGLLVWKNEHRFLRMDKTCGAHAWNGDVRFERHQWQTALLVGRGIDLRNVRQLYLRLERSGDVFTGFASADGITWQNVGSTVMGMSDPVHVGLYALAPGNVPPTLTRFDFFRISRRKRDVLRDQKATDEESRARQMLAFKRTMSQLQR